MKVQDLKVDRDLEADGVWVEFRDGMEVRVARAGNPEFRKLWRALTRPYQRQLRTGTLSPQKEDELTVRCMARALLRDWRGLEDESGEPIGYDPAFAERLLMDSPELRNFVSDVATEYQMFREQRLEEDAEILGEGSAGD